MDAKPGSLPNGAPSRYQSGPELDSSSRTDGEWNRDQTGQVEDRELASDESSTNSPDTSPLQDDEDGIGTTEPAGSEGTTRL
jgi:hypothetical protein